jgi:hypothetical protein
LRYRGYDILPAAPWQVDIEEHDVGLASRDSGDRRLHVIGLADDLDLIAELGPDARPEQAVIVDDEDPRPGAVPLAARWTVRWFGHWAGLGSR